MSEAIGINYQSQYINERITVAEEGQSCSTQFHEGREKNTYCQPLPPQIKENKIILYCNKKIVSVQNDV